MTSHRLSGFAALVNAMLLVPALPVAAQSVLVPERAIAAELATSGQERRQSKKGEQDKTDAEREQEKSEKKQDPPATLRFTWKDHPSLEIGKRTHVDFRARVQSDALGSGTPSAGADESADVARRRIGVGGDIEHIVEFQVERELGDDEPLRDVYANYHQFEAVQIQAGKFKLPFSLDENTSVTNLDFVYRSLAANQLAPGRDRGVMVHGRLFGRTVRYEVGLFDHDGRNGRTRNPARVFGERTTAGRLTVQPFRSLKSEAADVQIGVAFSASNMPLGFSSLRGRTFLDESFFDPDFWVQGERRRTGLELRWRPGPFSVKSEYMRVTTERRGQSVEDTDLSSLVATGWYISGTWAVTGEKKVDGLNRPRRPLFQGGYGAIELACRVESLMFGSKAKGELPSESVRADVIVGNADRAVTFGVNWYLNRWVKLQFNAINESLKDPRQGPRPGDARFWSRVIRFQFTI